MSRTIYGFDKKKMGPNFNNNHTCDEKKMNWIFISAGIYFQYSHIMDKFNNGEA